MAGIRSGYEGYGDLKWVYWTGVRFHILEVLFSVIPLAFKNSPWLFVELVIGQMGRAGMWSWFSDYTLLVNNEIVQ